MKKRTAIAFVTAVCGAISAYTAWCARPFYCKPLLELPRNLPPDGATAISEWYSEESDFDCIAFTPELFFRYLCFPWVEHRRVLAVHEPRRIAEFETSDPLGREHTSELKAATVGAIDSVEYSVEDVAKVLEEASMPYTEITVTDGSRRWHFRRTFGEVRWQLGADCLPEN